MRATLLFLCLLVLVGYPHPALADQGVGDSDAASSSRAAELKRRGDEAMDALRYDDAIAAYTQAYETGHDPAVLYNRGRVYQARGEMARALDDLERFAADAPPAMRARVPKLAELLTEARARVATLDVRCSVPGARVLLRGVAIGVTPIERLRVNAGPATVEIIAAGYAPHRLETVLAGGGSSAVDVALVPTAREAVLVVSATGSPATVYVDGERMGVAPIEIPRSAGAHRIVLRREDAPEQERSAVLAAGERREVQFDPAGTSGALSGKWWFWAGVAGVAAGAAITIFLVTRPAKSPSDGDGFQPSRVGAALVKW